MKRILYYGTVLLLFACYFGWRWWESQPIVIRVSHNALTLDEAPLSIDQLAGRLRTAQAQRRRARVVVAADPGLPAAQLIEVVKRANEAGVDEIAYETLP